MRVDNTNDDDYNVYNANYDRMIKQTPALWAAPASPSNHSIPGHWSISVYIQILIFKPCVWIFSLYEYICCRDCHNHWDGGEGLEKSSKQNFTLKKRTDGTLKQNSYVIAKYFHFPPLLLAIEINQGMGINFVRFCISILWWKWKFPRYARFTSFCLSASLVHNFIEHRW